MNKKKVFSIGVMSGTSLDGVDLVYANFEKSSYSNFEILHATTIPYSLEWKQLLQNAMDLSNKELKDLDVVYGKYLGKIINHFILNFKIKNIDFIASHGHTILHQPQKGITLQIGFGKEIAKITQQKVICDFRTQDVKLGGQGAPLVPIGDKLLFGEYDFCLNLGGFSNISFDKDGERIAYDICPVNIVLNFYANKIGLEYDAFGKIASKGKINDPLLEKLNSLEFYKKEPPKSLGLEWVQQEIFPLIERFEKDVSSILRTFVAHIAIQISKVIAGNQSVLVTGGGVFNSFLMKQIEKHSNVKIKENNKKIINYKEALIFAFLGLLKLDNQVNCLKSVTGAEKNHSSGVIFTP
ncbi:anhydro-N-acetylmuramic acid kinase [Polaribacter batillariae]|uniref:Anhydro-N-acetylmuramic acid kinase n=1 Tax=Polaribacter batillariae TaxID=2808900 RepID=A0ABX7SSQ4_9FLAO|nr:anhydro-N-acetylmuramic acid kinase [Polaribacter batillariae]QTD37285.1 anhydro-N-acetylmuramic acid kinase [Polaribacter batillariae]